MELINQNDNRLFDLQSEIGSFTSLLSEENLYFFLIIPIGIVAAIVWKRIYTRSLFKLAGAFILGVLALGLVLLIPKIKSFVFVS